MPGIGDYHETRFTHDPARRGVWAEIADYLRPYFPPEASVLELGGGYCEFINAVPGATRQVVDLFEALPRHAAPGVTAHVGDATSLSFIEDESVDVALASNFFEHLDREGFERCIGEVRRVLRPGGRLLVIGPNFRLCAANYFDDYTHRLIFTDNGMCDWLESLGLRVERVEPRFMPFSMKSRLPKARWMVRLYLRLPLRPLAGQFFVCAAKPVEGA
ncbi:SAM-dependent methyltransferase [Desulfobaculum xiamenense]|uniref:SAM-dependent methyltransferase n=1 Tax=Desulfobaculum xiamenense TaxID=995050 RepID=A0A846QNB1_9BACT|nr:class I SAM-dependent methyltransferase [Desulfobaculum xiamenense]NJB68677.1 SAM-dependent methyltransferase [Desulfobaculum xiamenense]